MFIRACLADSSRSSLNEGGSLWRRRVNLPTADKFVINYNPLNPCNPRLNISLWLIMLEALEYYQSLAQKFQSQLLTGPGILIVLAGICIWLSGLRWKRILGALAGATIGAACVRLAGQCPAGIIMAACIIGLIIGAIVSEITLGLFDAALGALAVMIILAGSLTASASQMPAVEFLDANQEYNPDKITADDFITQSYPTWPQYEQMDVIAAPAAIEITNKMALYFADRAKKIMNEAGTGIYAGAGFAVMIIIVFALVAGRLFVSVTSAMLGAGLIFTGMTILLFHKGSEPVGFIAQRPGFYWLIFTAMTVFGAFVQMVLSPPTAKPAEIKMEDKENGEKK